jgi:hypothetical protein
MVSRKRFTGGSWLCALAALWLSKPLAAALFGIGFLAALSAWEPIGSRLPTVAIRVRPPQRSGHRRLRRDALALGADIHAYLKTVPPQPGPDPDWYAMLQAREAATSKEESNRLWREYTDRMTERYARETQQLRERFGGRVQYVVGELVRRGALPPDDAMRIDWESTSPYWLGQAANRIEAGAHRL